MCSIVSKIPSKSPIFSISRRISRNLCSSSAAAAQTQKLERIADELISLTRLERYDYSVLFRHKLGIHKYGPSISMTGASALSSAGSAAAAADSKAAEKTAFDVRLEKFDTSVKLKIVKEVRTFTDLGLKEAKDMVDKAPVVVKKGVTKEEAEAILAKLKELGATAVLE